MVSVIFQEPMTALNPVYTVGFQIAEMLRSHQAMAPKAARARAIELLKMVEIKDAGPSSRRVPPPALWWSAAASHDRPGTCVGPKAAHCGRAHHGGLM